MYYDKSPCGSKLKTPLKSVISRVASNRGSRKNLSFLDDFALGQLPYVDLCKILFVQVKRKEQILVVNSSRILH